MMNELRNKVAVVTGASKGIGAGIAKALAAAGAAVVVNYASDKEGADAVVGAIARAGGEAVAVCGNVSRAADAQAVVEAAIQRFGQLDILVNNAGVYKFASLDAITEELYRWHFDTNVWGMLLVSQAAARHLPAGGSIINVGSLANRMAFPHHALYCASKAAVHAITGSLAKELGPRQIRVNTVSPGVIETEGAAEIIAGGLGQTVAAQTPLGRLGRPDDVAKVAVFLASDDAGWLTGEELFISGGG